MTQRKDPRGPKAALTGLVAIHFIVAVWHGNAHTDLAVDLSAAQTVFVYLVIIFAPLVAISLLWTRYTSPALWLFLASMCASFLFGWYHHYILVSPDNIHHLPAGSAQAHSHFTASAATLALVELFSALCAAFCLGWNQSRSAGSPVRTHG